MTQKLVATFTEKESQYYITEMEHKGKGKVHAILNYRELMACCVRKEITNCKVNGNDKIGYIVTGIRRKLSDFPVAYMNNKPDGFIGYVYKDISGKLHRCT